MPEIVEQYLASNIIVGFNDDSTWLLTDTPPDNPGVPPQATTFVITACNPRSEQATLEQNHLASLALEDALKTNNLHYGLGWGTSQDNLHAELSFCVETTNATETSKVRELLTHLAVQFEQNAIFEINGPRVTLIPCLLPEASGEVVKYATKLSEPQSEYRAKLNAMRWVTEASPRELLELDRFLINNQPHDN